MSTAPNMATITAALERSLQNCSLSHHQAVTADSHGGLGNSSSSNQIAQQNHHLPSNSETALELNSHISLPYHWEQCLDLKTGEIYYINWRNGMKAKEDPRSSTEEYIQDYYSEDEDEDEDDSSYDSEESSTESLTREPNNKNNNKKFAMEAQQEEGEEEEEEHVLVVAGCKSCLMYFMVPKHLEDCPKCTGQLLHFDRSENDIP